MLDTKIEGATVVGGRRASGLPLAPGFIDVHSHSDGRLWANRRAESKVRQGVTTEVVGNCGFSPAPVNPSFREDLRGFALYLPEGMDFSWQSVEEYLRRFDQGGCALNLIQLVGHGTLRIAAMGFARRTPSDRELAHMQRLLAGRPAGGGVPPGALRRRGPAPGARGVQRAGGGARPPAGFLREPHPGRGGEPPGLG